MCSWQHKSRWVGGSRPGRRRRSAFQFAFAKERKWRGQNDALGRRRQIPGNTGIDKPGGNQDDELGLFLLIVRGAKQRAKDRNVDEGGKFGYAGLEIVLEQTRDREPLAVL